MIKNILFLVFCLPQVLLAQAADVSCWDEDCLKNGWTWQNASQIIDYGCYRDGCDKSGWIANNPNKIYTQCKNQSCFTEGWYQVDMLSQNLERDIVCNSQGSERNCFKYGWTAYSRTQGQLFTVMCLSQDCFQQGWTVQFINGQILQVVCKAGGCFKTGWREF